jgi:hypothetical protein
MIHGHRDLKPRPRLIARPQNIGNPMGGRRYVIAGHCDGLERGRHTYRARPRRMVGGAGEANAGADLTPLDPAPAGRPDRGKASFNNRPDLASKRAYGGFRGEVTMYRYLWLGLAAGVLGGCAAAGPHTLTGMVTEAVSPGAHDAYEAAQDDKKCRSFGYSPEASTSTGNAGCNSSNCGQIPLPPSC